MKGAYPFGASLGVILPCNFYTVNLTLQTKPEIGYRNTFLYNNLPRYYSG